MSLEFIAIYLAVGFVLSIWGAWGEEVGVNFVLSTIVTMVLWPALIAAALLAGARRRFGISFWATGHSYLFRRQINTWLLFGIGHWGVAVIHDIPKPEGESVGE